MNLLSENDRFPLATPGIRLVDPDERHRWRGPDGEEVIYRRLGLNECDLKGTSVLDGIIDWKGFRLDGVEAPFQRALAEGLPHRIQILILTQIRAADFDGGNRGESILFYRVPVISVIDRLRRRATVRGELDYFKYVPEMVGWSLRGWENVIAPDGSPAEFNPENVARLPLEAVGIFWDRLLAWISGQEEQEELELKNSTPTSGD